MSSTISLNTITPTVMLRRSPDGMQQLVRIVVANSGKPASGVLAVQLARKEHESPLASIPSGESTHEVFVPETKKPASATFTLKVNGQLADQKDVSWTPPRRWVVHVIQLSHHDVGYTDLATNVLREHDEFLDSAIDMAAATSRFPSDARFRFVVEQTWSLTHFLRNAPPARAKKMIQLLRSGRVEATALFGNLTTELCGHETMVRATHQAFDLNRQYGIPITSAEHNDVPGISWGVASVLTEGGVKIFCPGLPLYYGWRDSELKSFWDERAIFPYEGPGAFWWEAHSGKRVLFWCNNQGCGGGCHPSLPGLADNLDQLASAGYPYSVVRYPVGGGARDNSPYIEGYTRTIREWNEKWAYPRLICSTNALFYKDFIKQVPADLPVFRGELPGQDYPSGATSTALATAANRNNHNDLMVAERLAALSAAKTDFTHPEEEISEAYEDVLWHDEHTWGHHFPCGPASRASNYEKAVHAFRAEALSHDVVNRALARIADHVKIDGGDIHLVVFNPLPYDYSGVVRAPMREFDNCGSIMGMVPPEEDPSGEGHLRGFLLTDRYHVNPPLEIVDGKFDLVDTSTGQSLPFQMVSLDSPDATIPYAPERVGIGSGGKRYAFMEVPLGLRRDCVFIAADVPACGYRTFRLVPRDNAPAHAPALTLTDDSLENEFYRITFDQRTGNLVSIFDKEIDRELLDQDAPHSFGDLVVRTPDRKTLWQMENVTVSPGVNGPVLATIERTGSVHAHPRVRQTITLYAGIKRVDFAVRILKDATPLLDLNVSFPFAATQPRFRYEGSLSIMDPIKDFLPGAFSDSLTVQNWAKVADDSHSVLWASLDGPMASFGDLWPGYVSPAHTCLVREDYAHSPLRLEDIQNGWIYSTVLMNNFGTNFSVSQSGEFLFRYSLTSQAGDASDSDCARFGSQVALPLQQIFTKHPRPRPLPASQSLLEIDRPEVTLLTCKPAEDGKGHILRLWNTEACEVSAKITASFTQINAVSLTDLGEGEEGAAVPHDGRTISLTLPPRALMTLRVV